MQVGQTLTSKRVSKRTLRAVALGSNTWGVLGSEVGGLTAAVLYADRSDL
jgi:transposase